MSDATDSWRIRIANQNDWDRISQIDKQIASEDGIGGYITDIGKSYLDIGKTYVFEENEIIGFQNARYVPDGSVYLSGLRVSSPFRKKKVATRLIGYALEEARNKGKTIARTYAEPSNLSSLSLLKKLGFSKTGRMNFYHGSVGLNGYEEVFEWPDSLIDIGHLPSFPYSGIPATLFRKDASLISVCNSNAWDKEATYTILSSGKYKFDPGKSFIAISSDIESDNTECLTPVKNFEVAYVMELSLGRAAGKESPNGRLL